MVAVEGTPAGAECAAVVRLAPEAFLVAEPDRSAAFVPEATEADFAGIMVVIATASTVDSITRACMATTTHSCGITAITDTEAVMGTTPGTATVMLTPAPAGILPTLLPARRY